METTMKTLLTLALTAALFASGCRSIIINEPPRTNHYYVNPRANMATVGRVALLELDNLSSHQELAGTFTQTLADELGKRSLFSLRKVMRSDAIWQSLKLDNMQAHTLDDLAAARQALSADAVLFGTIQRYMSFPHLQMSLTLKLVDTRSGQLLWAFEDVWDSGDKTVERRMQNYFKNQMRTGYEPINWQILVTSPLAFNGFVAWEVAKTLPN
jgi:TolB-like protein